MEVGTQCLYGPWLGSTLRWTEHAGLRRMVDELVGGIWNCSEPLFGVGRD